MLCSCLAPCAAVCTLNNQHTGPHHFAVTRPEPALCPVPPAPTVIWRRGNMHDADIHIVACVIVGRGVVGQQTQGVAEEPGQCAVFGASFGPTLR